METDGRRVYDTVISDNMAVPPDDRDGWERVFSFGVGKVSGAGNSPSRSSV
jgi:hypothetical protein